MDNGIVVITLVRPEVLNALHPEACAEIGLALDRYEADDTARVAIITGAGNRAFCAGFDLQYAEQHPELYRDPLFASEVVRRANNRKPLIAAVNGVALGLGFELALACDLILASTKARFGLPEVKVGLAAMAGGVVRLTREIGPKRTLALVLRGEILSALEGKQLGFVNEVIDGDVMDVARQWAATLACNAPLSLIASKQMVYHSLDLPNLQSALDPRQYPEVMAVLDSADAHEGRHAFLEHRQPEWVGR
ncbi:enoyl-CoA hydratase-related protein [Ferribacterium limneticum]|uniref:enoyl-CoA hydratase-related protein n=1 Tax=Ferribacterium limneticum TaxID=76259 RepID=UPI001CF81E3E|nr:enoyl-CoA hydratase-related protein [Ferribacterium limneticum]UCV23610.1 enoyl-CoA hydratase/isomerase family protein [Ferribacterium limneticum]